MNNIKYDISVIIPTYNRGHVVKRAICSVLDQTYLHFEVIVVDDASRDNTKVVVEGIKDSRVRFMSHSSNKGGGAARNTGIRASRGRYLGFLDSNTPLSCNRELGAGNTEWLCCS